MKKLGIHGNIVIWIYNFLVNRKQFVIANGAKSKESIVKSGVLQSTVLGPLLLLIMINDIDQNIVESNIIIFAEYSRISEQINNEEDVEALQKDLEKLYSWAKENNMTFNCTKFEVLIYISNEEIKKDNNYLTPNSVGFIDVKNVLRDLGIMMNAKPHLKNT